MNGAQQYAAATELIAGLKPERLNYAEQIALAQVRATLALVAATAFSSPSSVNRSSWDEVLG